jgi:hypothetical protein
MATHEFVQHDEEADAGHVDTISGTADDEFAETLSLETGVTAETVHAVRGWQGDGRGGIDDGDVCQGLGGDLVETATDVWLEGGSGGGRIENVGPGCFDGDTGLRGRGERGGEWGRARRTTTGQSRKIMPRAAITCW